MRESTPSPVFDNITFFMNALDTLVGDESWLALRTSRARFRTLERIEAQTRGFMEQRALDEQAAKADADRALAAATEALQARIRGIQERTDLDQQSKEAMVRAFQDADQRKLDVLKGNIEQTRDGRIVASREVMEREVRRLQLFIRVGAITAPVAPIVVVGLFTYARRRQRQWRRSMASGQAIRP
jgi:ABC-2 type transport system permease protein